VIRNWLNFLKGQHRGGEDSIAFRIAVALNVGAAIAATAAQLQWDLDPLCCLGLTWLAMLFSYKLRNRNNWEVKALLSIGMVMAMFLFFDHLSRSTNDPRVPLAELLLWLQTLHSFDLPARKDLAYSMLVALTLISVAAVLSVNLWFGPFLILYLATALAALYWNGLAAAREQLSDPGTLVRAKLPPVRLGLNVAAFSLLCLVLMPRYQSFRLRSLPVNWQMQFKMSKVSGGLLHNSAYPNAGSAEEFRRKAKFNPDSYSGFNSFVDLQMRGRLSDEILIRARSSAFCYYRGLAFVHYDGEFWARGTGKPQTLITDQPPMRIPHDVPEENAEEVVQIFYVDKDLPNLVLAANQPILLYFPSQQIYFDADHDLLSPYELAEGTVYSVVSRRLNLPAWKLRQFKGRDPKLARMGDYRELPKELPLRVGELARRVTAGAKNPYDQALALCTYLQTHYRYEVDTPRYAEHHDVTDSFLFDAKVGYCEEFATAMAIMGRTVGLNTRYITGYLPGDYNPLTGYQEIKAHHAHAWVEVYLPRYGWVSFDPTPGAPGSLETEQGADHSGWIVGDYARYLLAKLHLSVGWLWAFVGVLGSVGLLAFRPRRQRVLSPGERIEAAYAAALALLPACLMGESPRQFAARVDREPLDRLTRLHERAVYSPESATEAEVGEANGALQELRT
jgi:transglutaminase-like putative cysteine protease